MWVYDVVSLVCLAVMVGIVATVLTRLIILKRPERIKYIRNFKKGQAAIIYIVAVPLYCMSLIYIKRPFFEALLDAISKSVYLIALKFDTTNVAALAKESFIFKFTTYLCFSLVIVNAVMIVISFASQWIWNKRGILRFLRGKGNKCILIGANNESKMIYRSCSDRKITLDFLSKEDCSKLYIDDMAYKAFRPEEEKLLFLWLYKQLDRTINKMRKEKEGLFAKNKQEEAKRAELERKAREKGKTIPPKKAKSDKELEKERLIRKAKIHIIINTKDEKKDLFFSGKLLEYIKTRGSEILPYLDICVFGSREFEDIYAKYDKESQGCLRYVNEYRQVAVDFIDKYPLTEFMDETYLDYETGLLRDGVDINVVMVGFGRTNQQLFLSMVANTQFLGKDEKGDLIVKAADYHLFDEKYDKRDIDEQRSCFRFEHVFYNPNGVKVDLDAYLPIPSLPAREYYYPCNENKNRFYDNLQASLTSDKKTFNYIIISLGEDYKSIDLTNRVYAKLKEWKMENCHVFVRIRDGQILKQANVFLDPKRCHTFGTSKEVVYDYAQVIQERFLEMATMRNFIYDIEKDCLHETVTEEERENSLIKWYTKRSKVERESNLYACLSLRSKLHMLGLDYCDVTDAREEITEEEYLKTYAKGDMPMYTEGKSAVRYPLEFKDSTRKNMAVQEHYRWNAYMITKGFVPADKQTILKEKDEKTGEYTNGKSYELCRHGNLTTFDGLVAFRKMVSKPSREDGKTEKDSDVIKYDYQLLDGAYWLLKQNGYKIVKR